MGEGTSYSLSAAERLKSQYDFQKVYKQRQFVRNRTLTLYFLQRETGPTRLGLSVGRRLGSAVKRNRVKRVLREVFRLHRAKLPQAFDIIMIPSQHAEVENFHTMRKSFLHLLRRLQDQMESASS